MVKILRAIKKALTKTPAEPEPSEPGELGEWRLQIITALVQNDGDVNTRTLDRQATPIIIAARCGDVDLVRVLLAAYADAGARDAVSMGVADYAKDRPDILALLQ